FKKALSQDKTYTRARHHLGNLYLQLKQYDRAEKELLRAANDRYYDDRSIAYNDIALMYYRQDRLEEAIQYYKETLRLTPYNAQALVNVSTLYFEQQNYEESQRFFNRLDRLVERDQINHTAHSLWLGIQLATINADTERAIALASDLKRNYPESSQYKLYQESLSGAK
ncbi:MAG TPA: tetratricopeptide repeat protein, partial [Pseudomonadales bacterium]|nr:tetratricopeptide repeat protein [Pseudomonadales bacterium]